MAKRKLKKRKPVIKVKKEEPTPIWQPGFFRNHWKYCLVVAAAVLAIYVQSANYDYVLDDRIVIWDNQFTKEGVSGIWDLLSTESFSGYFGQQRDLVPGARYRPLSIVTFAIEYELFGLNPTVGHVGNIVLYLLLCLLVFRICQDLFRRYNGPVVWLSFGFCVSLLFAVHPLHTEAVANIKGRDEILSLLFSLLALFYFIKGLDTKKFLWPIISSLFLYLGLISKENTITFLAAIPLTAYYFSEHSLKRIAAYMSPLFLITLVYLFVRYQIIGYLMSSGIQITEIMNNPFVYMNFGEKYATIFYTLGLYLKLGFFPHPLTHDYYPFHIPTLNWTDFRAILSFLSYLVLGIIALLGIRKKRIISFAILFYMATLSTASNLLFTVGTFMNERFIFVSLLSFCIVIVYALFHGIPKFVGKWTKHAMVALFSLIFLAYSIKSFTRVPAWKNTLSLNLAAIKVSKNSARANTFVASALYQEQKEIEDPEQKIRYLDDAYGYSSRAIELLPDYSAANTVRAGVVADMYLLHRDLDRLLRDFKVIALNKPFLPYLHQYYEYLNGRGVDLNKLLNHYYNMGYEEFFARRHDYDAALKYLNYGLSLYNQSVAFHDALGQVYEAMGNQNSSQYHFQKAAEFRSQ